GHIMRMVFLFANRLIGSFRESKTEPVVILKQFQPLCKLIEIGYRYSEAIETIFYEFGNAAANVAHHRDASVCHSLQERNWKAFKTGGHDQYVGILHDLQNIIIRHDSDIP